MRRRERDAPLLFPIVLRWRRVNLSRLRGAAFVVVVQTAEVRNRDDRAEWTQSNARRSVLPW